MLTLLPPLNKLSGRLQPPSSKSLLNRHLLMAAFGSQPCQITPFTTMDDSVLAKQALIDLGISIESSDHSLTVTGRPAVTQAKLQVGNAGTLARPLTALLASWPGEWMIDSDPAMQTRPMAPLIDTLRQAGAQIECSDKASFPLKIKGQVLKGGHLKLDPRASSQFVSALLMAAPLWDQGMTLELSHPPSSAPYIDLTIDALKKHGIMVEHQKTSPLCYKVTSQSYTSPESIAIEGDASAALPFMAAAAIKGGPLHIHGIAKDSLQADWQWVQVLKEMGAKVEFQSGGLMVEGGRLQGLEISCNHLPDAVPVLAMTALFAQGETTIKDIAHLAYKESDRLQGLAKALVALGANIELGTDRLSISPPAQIKAATLDPQQDHRLAMAFAVAACSGIEHQILDASCVSKTYPKFWEDWRRLSADNGDQITELGNQSSEI